MILNLQGVPEQLKFEDNFTPLGSKEIKSKVGIISPTLPQLNE